MDYIPGTHVKNLNDEIRRHKKKIQQLQQEKADLLQRAGEMYKKAGDPEGHHKFSSVIWILEKLFGEEIFIEKKPKPKGGEHK